MLWHTSRPFFAAPKSAETSLGAADTSVCATFPAMFLMSGLAFAQTGQITGQVSDPTGARVPAASVTVANIGTGVSSETSTNVDGYYTVPFLPPGDYRISVSKGGFKSASRSPVKL